MIDSHVGAPRNYATADACLAMHTLIKKNRSMNQGNELMR